MRMRRCPPMMVANVSTLIDIAQELSSATLPFCFDRSKEKLSYSDSALRRRAQLWSSSWTLIVGIANPTNHANLHE